MQSIPSEFGKKNFDLDKKGGYICFQVSNNKKTWPAKYTRRISNKGRMKFEITGGWKKFSEDNNLKVGDACNFELILKTNMTFTFLVHIFRETSIVQLSR